MLLATLVSLLASHALFAQTPLVARAVPMDAVAPAPANAIGFSCPIASLPANCREPTAAETSQLDISRALCEAHFSDNRCEQLIKHATPEERARFMDCSKAENLCTVGNRVDFKTVCGASAKVALQEFADDLLNLPSRAFSAVINSPATLTKCLHDDAFKKQILGRFRPKDMPDLTIQRMTCADIQQFVATKVEAILRSLDERALQAGTNDVRKLTLTESEQDALEFDLSKTAPYRQAACYTPTEQIKFVCRESANFATGLALGAGTGAALRGVKFLVRSSAAWTGDALTAAGKAVSLETNAAGASAVAAEAPAPRSRFASQPLKVLPAADLAVPESLGGSRSGRTFRRLDDGSYVLADAKGKKLGEFTLYVRGESLSVESIMVNPQEFRKGISQVLMKQALADHPEVTKIKTGDLLYENRRLLEEARARGLSLEDAVRQTPAYRIRAKLGFTEIVNGSIDPHDYGFVSTRLKWSDAPVAPGAAPLKNSDRGFTLTLSPAAEQALREDQN